MNEDKKNLKYFLDNKNFSRKKSLKITKTSDILQVVNDQIVLNTEKQDNEESTIVTSYTYLKNKGNKKRWDKKDTQLFYDSLECCGCDFSMINLLFPKRSRSNLKEKYKKESKINSNKIEEILNKYTKFDIEKFNQLKERTEND